MMTQKQLGDRILQLRQSAGLTQEELAAKYQVATKTIQRIESNQVSPRAYTLRVLSSVLKEDLLESSELPHRDQLKRSLLWHQRDLLNLKTNRMKKISILGTTLTVICIAVFLMSGTSPKLDMEHETSKTPKSGITVQADKTGKVEAIDVVFSSQQSLDSLIAMQNQLKKW